MSKDEISVEFYYRDFDNLKTDFEDDEACAIHPSINLYKI